jgi:hypothetical protein
MRLGHQRVEHDHLVTCVGERVGDRGPDETGTTGDKYAHSGTVASISSKLAAAAALFIGP